MEKGLLEGVKGEGKRISREPGEKTIEIGLLKRTMERFTRENR